MKGKKYTYDAQKENAIFARKLRGLFEEQGVTQKKLADFITQKTGESITRQSIGQWCSGNTCPSLKTIPVIAEFFGVSTDYLLTDTPVQNPEADVIAVCEYTGLSEEAVNFLNALQSQAIGDSIAPELKIDRTLKQYKSLVEERQKTSIAKSKCALMAISELLSAPERETFVINLALLFSNFSEYSQSKEIKIDNVEDIWDFYERAIELPNKIIETVLLNEIQSYIKGIKTNIYNQQRDVRAFYSFDKKKDEQQERSE